MESPQGDFTISLQSLTQKGYEKHKHTASLPRPSPVYPYGAPDGDYVPNLSLFPQQSGKLRSETQDYLSKNPHFLETLKQCKNIGNI